MKLIDTNDFLLGSHGLNRFRESLVSKLVMYILRLHKLDKLNVKVNDDDPEVLLDSLIEALGVTIDVSKEDLEKIPKEGTFITVSNHPFGGLDGIVLVRLLCKLRPDYKIMSNFLLKKIVPLQDYILGLDPEESKKDSNMRVIKEAIRHVIDGKPLGIFPAGEVSSYQADSNHVEDKEWDSSVLKLVKLAKVPVIPIYFKGSNSLLFYLLGMIHPVLKTIKLPSELLNKKNRVVKLRIGNPISVETQNTFHDIAQYGKFLRAKTSLLGSALEVKKFFIKSQKAIPKAEPVAA